MLKNTKIPAYAWIRWKTSPYAYHILILEGALKHGTQRNLKMLEYIKNAFARFSFIKQTFFYFKLSESRQVLQFCEIESKNWAHFCLTWFKVGKTALNCFKLSESLHMLKFCEIESKKWAHFYLTWFKLCNTALNCFKLSE